jgi:hypothetical protein
LVDAINPWTGQTLGRALDAAAGAVGAAGAAGAAGTGELARVLDVPVKVIVQNRASWGTTFYLGRLTLEDSKDVSRRCDVSICKIDSLLQAVRAGRFDSQTVPFFNHLICRWTVFGGVPTLAPEFCDWLRIPASQ